MVWHNRFGAALNGVVRGWGPGARGAPWLVALGRAAATGGWQR